MSSRIRCMVLGSALSAGAGLLLGAAAFQPGLEPPSGPVNATSPSLAEINAKIDDLLSGAFPEDKANLVISEIFAGGVGTSQTLIPGSGSVRLRSFIITNGVVDLRDSSGLEVLRLSANATQNAQGVTGFAQYDLNIDVELPLTIERLSNFQPAYTVLFTPNN
ncbi:MAG: hypothetical protein AAFR76_06085 [Planctomycetota bacterium]